METTSSPETPAASMEVDDLARLAVSLAQAPDAQAACRLLRGFVASRTPMSGMFVSRYDPEAQLRTCLYAFSENEELDPNTFPAMPNTGSPHSRAVTTGQTILTQDFQEAMAGKPRMNVGLERDPRLPQSSIVVPLKANGQILGAVEIQSVKPSAFRPEHVLAFETAAHLTALALSNVHAMERERQARAEIEARAAQLEASVRERVRELAAKNRELEAFSFTVAHDLRAPLRGVLNLSRDLLARHGGKMDTEARADLDAIHHSSVRMAELVEDLLSFARTAQGSVKRELVDMTALARAVLSEFVHNEPHRKTDLHVQENLYVEADAALVRILLDNLLGNAWKYSSRKPATLIRVGARLQEGEVVYYVQDGGIGFDPSQSARLFSIFQRLHEPNDYEGTGIGLATAQRIVQRHGGRIWADTKLGEGATFYFTLNPKRTAADRA